MVKDISNKQKSYSSIKYLILGLNILGIVCLISLAIPYITHDTFIPNPNAMLAGPRWDLAGFGLLLGIIPLAVVNTAAYMVSNFKNNKLKLLFFIPTLICFILGIHYLTVSYNEEEPTEPDNNTTYVCTIKNQKRSYDIYEENDEISLGIEEDDKIDVGELDYSTKEKLIETLNNYYKTRNGSCIEKKSF